MDNFELGKPGWFEAQNVQENDFLNQKLTSDQYGIWYSVKFVGDATTHLWQTKTPPEEGKKYWGWIEKTSSGKSTKFKWDKQNAPSQDGPPKYQKSAETEENIARAVALKAGVDFLSNKAEDPQDVLAVAELFLAWLKNEKPTTDASESLQDPEDIDFPNDDEDIGLDNVRL